MTSVTDKKLSRKDMLKSIVMVYITGKKIHAIQEHVKELTKETYRKPCIIRELLVWCNCLFRVFLGMLISRHILGVVRKRMKNHLGVSKNGGTQQPGFSYKK